MTIQSAELLKAKRKFSFFMIWSAISFNLLSGQIIILYILKFGAGNFLIGIISSFVYISQIMPLIGKKVVHHTGMIRLMAGSWFVRYLIMIPLLFIPLFYNGQNSSLVLGLCTVCIFFFNLSRGIGITSYNPIIGGLTTNADRGSYFSIIAFIFHSATVIVNIAIAVLLGKDAPLFMYTIFISGGIVTGIFSSLVLFRVPEPTDIKVFDTKPLHISLKEAFKRKGFRRFIIPHLSIFFVIAMISPFLIVFIKQVYNQPDSTIIYFLVIGAGGAILMSLVSNFLLDRLGAKPLYFIYALAIIIMLTISLIAPGGESHGIDAPSGLPLYFFWIYAGVLFFLFRLGETGINNTGNVYFFSVIDEKERLNLGAVYQIAIGIAASAGSVLGGIYLDSISLLTGFSIGTVFRIFFSSLLGVSIVIIVLIFRMERCGAYSIKDAVSIIFSPRDWRAISLLKKLEDTNNEIQERDVIKSLGKNPSRLSKTDLLEKLKSPRFSIRAETLNALSGMPMNKEIEDALIDEVKRHHFTTAFLAAKIIGKQKIQRAVPALREVLHSEDFFLCGKAMVALARLEDRESIHEIEQIVLKSKNPRVIIHGVHALEIFKNIPSIQILFKKLFLLSEILDPDLHSYVKDEIILAVSGIAGMDSFFYPLYGLFKKEKSLGISQLIETIEKYTKKCIIGETIALRLKKLLSEQVDSSESIRIVRGLSLEDAFTKPYVCHYLFIAFTSRLSDISQELHFMIISYMVWCVIQQ